MKFFPTIEYVDEIAPYILDPELSAKYYMGTRFDGLCTYYSVSGNIIIHIQRGKRSKFVLFHELCHWLIYRISKQDSCLGKKLHGWVERFIV